MTEFVYMLDRGDDASEMLQDWIKKERGILNRDIVRIAAKGNLIESIKEVDFEGQAVVELYMPTLWEGTEKDSAWGPELAKATKALMIETDKVDIRFAFPFSKLQLIDVINDKPTEELKNGDCSYTDPEAPYEQCGMCLDCVEKFLCYKLNDIDTIEAFMEHPFMGYGSKERLYTILSKLSGSTFGKAERPTKQEISIGALMVECFFQGLLPSDISNVMEDRFQVLLVESASA